MTDNNTRQYRDEPMFLTVQQVAKRLGVSYNSVRGLIDAGALTAYRFGPGRGVYRIDPDDLDDYIGGSVVVPKGPPLPQKPSLSHFKHLRPQRGDKDQRGGRK